MEKLPSDFWGENNYDQKKFHRERNNHLFCFIGHNETGKSITARDMAMQWKEKRNSDIVMAHDPQHRFTDVADILINPFDEGWEERMLKMRNGLIILDDYKMIYKNFTHTKGLEELLYTRTNRNNDIIIICHNPALIINLFTYFITHYLIFYTQSKEGSFEKKIPNYNLCYAASNMVNKYVKIYGRGKYPNFPHIIIDTQKQEMFPINMRNIIARSSYANK